MGQFDGKKSNALLDGGNVAGGVKAAGEAATSGLAATVDIVRGDCKSADKFTNKLEDGDYGRVAEEAAHAGECQLERAGTIGGDR